MRETAQRYKELHVPKPRGGPVEQSLYVTLTAIQYFYGYVIFGKDFTLKVQVPELNLKTLRQEVLNTNMLAKALSSLEVKDQTRKPFVSRKLTREERHIFVNLFAIARILPSKPGYAQSKFINGNLYQITIYVS
jgi:hypothetical protein